MRSAPLGLQVVRLRACRVRASHCPGFFPGYHPGALTGNCPGDHTGGQVWCTLALAVCARGAGVDDSVLYNFSYIGNMQSTKFSQFSPVG
jgi:hypothetical protein